MKLIRVGVDLAKNVFQVHGIDRNEKPVWRRKLSRAKWLKTLLETVEPGCEIGMEACGGAHDWARRLQAHGYKVRLIAPQFVKPYVKSNKNDANDAEAICEAMGRPNMRFVSVKTVEQQDIQAVHRVRFELSNQRKAKANQIRGLVSEYGLVAPKELLHLRSAIPDWLEDAENGLTALPAPAQWLVARRAGAGSKGDGVGPGDRPDCRQRSGGQAATAVARRGADDCHGYGGDGRRCPAICQWSADGGFPRTDPKAEQLGRQGTTPGDH